MLIYYVDALAGAGKTHGAIEHAIERARRGDKVAIVQPSRHLIQQSYIQATQIAPDLLITRLDSSTNPRRVRAALIAHLNRPYPEGEILFVTHAAFFGLPYWHNRPAWHIIVDEIPNVVEDLSRRVPVSHHTLTQHLELHGRNHVYSRIGARDGAEAVLRAIAENELDDESQEIFAPAASRILDPNWLVLAHTANYEKFSTGRATARGSSLGLFGLMLPAALGGFASLTVMGAMFRESVLAMVWRCHGAVFEPHPVIQDRLRYHRHDNGAQLTIEYLWEHHWSKRFRDSTLSDRSTVFETSLRHACGIMAGKEFIYVANLDGEDIAGHALPGGIQVPSVCHGLNAYSHIDNCVFLSALKFTGDRYKCLETLDVNRDELDRAHYLQSVYQAVMRTSLRDPSCTRPKHVVVMDRMAADYLASQFLGATVAKAPTPRTKSGRVGRPALWRDEAARKRAERNRARVLGELAALHQEAKSCVSLIPSIYSRDVLHHEVTSNQALMQELRHALNTEVSGKKQNILISPALFEVTKGAETRRGLDNITQVYGIWLDNDGGDLTPDALRGIFPGLWMACFSTYSGGDRYRVFIPTSQPMTVEADAAVKRMIFDQLCQAGYHDASAERGKRHGFDTSKLTASSLFFLPCRQPGADVFFIEFPGEELDPQAWIARPTVAGLFDVPEPILLPTPPVPQSPAPPPLASAEADTACSLIVASGIDPQVDRARQVYATTPKGAGLRNAAFFRFGLELRRLGLSMPEIERHLRTTADDADRRRQIKSIMRSLGRRL
ncbi:DEAD/DEAH box helicase family protein [Roseicella aerolata]|uniref:DEAD/DEAH box helicase family protein n=1 Tax=Roseicella aerolata TaxID=2883479 RepID=A0A9X1L9K8_9PROT|nr:DEAD/DEAH box helicase family protein [Roseicella aerolata]MCB4821243.1 DEAD/DEAH box helicase family protein [Roseicella aerolata]